MVEEDPIMVNFEAEEKVKVKVKKIKLSSEQIASRERAHGIKVAKFLAGGKF